jgi:hypothetical protein
MSVNLKQLIMVSILASATILATGPSVDAAKKRKARAAAAPVSSAPYNGGVVAPGGVPRWVQYDQGGMYYYSRNELEKAKQYWLASLKLAEQAVPAEKAKGLSVTTEQNACNLINHLAMFVSDTKLNPNGAVYGSQGYSGLPNSVASSQDPRRLAYDSMVAHLRTMKEDARWLDRVMVFAERTVGKDNRCLASMKGTRGQMAISEQNCKYTMANLERELNIGRSSVDSKPINPTAGNNSGLAPNGEYIPPGNNP